MRTVPLPNDLPRPYTLPATSTRPDLTPPTPPPIALGVDLVRVSRFEPMLTDEFKRRAFTLGELAAREGPDLAVRLAGCFAAKEAILKALGTGWTDGISWTEIEVVHVASGAPMVTLSGRAQEVATERGVTRWLLSLSHDGDYATATAIGLGPSQATSSDSGSGE